MVVARAALALVLAVVSPLTPAAEVTRYISDQLTVTLQAGPGPRQRVLETLASGQAVRWLADKPESGYSQIQTPSGKIGWVASAELMTQIPAKIQLLALQNERAELAPLQAELRQTQQALQKLQLHNQQQMQELAELRQAAAQPQQLLAENQVLRTQHQQLAHERDLLHQENQILKQRSAQDWFMVGAGVLLAGILLGAILPRLGRRQRWSEF